MSLNEDVVIKFKLGQKAKVFLENGSEILEVTSFNINYYDNRTDRLILVKENEYHEYVSVDKAGNVWKRVFADTFSRETYYGVEQYIEPVLNEEYI